MNTDPEIVFFSFFPLDLVNEILPQLCTKLIHIKEN